MFRRPGKFVPLLLMVALGACRQPHDASAPVADAPTAATPLIAERIAKPAWLAARLPEHALAYLRIPSPWGLASAPNGRALDPALASAAHQAIVESLRHAIADDPATARPLDGSLLALLFGNVVSPLEIAAIDASGSLSPASTILASAALDVADVADLNAKLAAAGTAAIPLRAPLDASGRGQFANGVGVIRFDIASKRLYVLVGNSATQATLDTLLGDLATLRAHPMQASEHDIDRSGQGLFAWLDVVAARAMFAAPFAAAANASPLLNDAMTKATALAFGWGTVDGHGRLQIRLDAPGARLLSYLAPSAYRVDLKSAGAPYWAVTFALPTRSQLDALVAHLDEDFGPGSAARYQSQMTEVKARLGVDPADLVSLVGPELVAWEDAAGSYWALRVRDRQALYATLDRLAQKFSWRRETNASGRAMVQHLSIPGFGQAPAGAMAPGAASFIAMYMRIGWHLYFAEEGDWLVFGAVPQALDDRAAATPASDLGAWLDQTQHYDAGRALIGATAVTRNARRALYYTYLGALRSLGDALNRPVDLNPLPSASALKLPVDGIVGIAIDASPGRLDLTLDYDETPLDFLSSGSGGSLTTLATTAILAAIALPSFSALALSQRVAAVSPSSSPNDADGKAQVANALAAVAPLKTAIAEYYLTQGKLPQTDKALGKRLLPGASPYVQSAPIDNGTIVIGFNKGAVAELRGKILVLAPYFVGQQLRWRCASAALPEGARTVPVRANKTNAPVSLLPDECH